MLGFKIKPEFRSNCIVYGKKRIIQDYNPGDTIFIVSKSNLPSKRFSILSTIDQVKYADDNIINFNVDESIEEKLKLENNVMIIKCNPLEAKKIFIAISDQYVRISSGDWSSIIKKSLEYKIIDYGKDIVFIIPWKNKEGKEKSPIIVNGTVFSTLPPPPVKVGSKTELILKKLPEEKLLKIKKENLIKTEERVEILKDEFIKDAYLKIQQIKQGNYPNKAITYEFKKTNPKYLFSTIIDYFKGYEIAEEPSEKFIEGNTQNFLASAVYFLSEFSDIPSIVDIQVLANELNSRLILNLTSKDEDYISNYLNKFDDYIHNIKGTLEQSANIFIEFCPNCGAPLPLEKANADGTIKCDYCKIICYLPKSYRY